MEIKIYKNSKYYHLFKIRKNGENVGEKLLKMVVNVEKLLKMVENGDFFKICQKMGKFWKMLVKTLQTILCTDLLLHSGY